MGQEAARIWRYGWTDRGRDAGPIPADTSVMNEYKANTALVAISARSGSIFARLCSELTSHHEGTGAMNSTGSRADVTHQRRGH